MVLVNSLPDYLLDYRTLPVLFPSLKSCALLNLAAALPWQKVPARAEGQREPGTRVSGSVAEGFSPLPGKFILDFLRALDEGGVAGLETTPRSSASLVTLLKATSALSHLTL